MLTSETDRSLPNAICAANVATGAIDDRSRAIDILMAVINSSLTRSFFSLDLISVKETIIIKTIQIIQCCHQMV